MSTSPPRRIAQRLAIRPAAGEVLVGASRDELGTLAELQAALRRVATLVAPAAPPRSEVFSAVAGRAWAAAFVGVPFEPVPLRGGRRRRRYWPRATSRSPR